MKNTTLRFSLSAGVLLAVCGGLLRAGADPKIQVPGRIGNGKINLNVPPDALIPKIDLIQARLEKLQADNVALKEEVEQLQKQVAQNSKDMVAVKLVIGGLDKSLTSLNTSYAKHTHTIPFAFSNPATVVNAPSPILVPWVSPGQIKGSFRTDGPTK